MTFSLHVDSLGRNHQLSRCLVRGATFVPSPTSQNKRRPKDAEEFFEWVEVSRKCWLGRRVEEELTIHSGVCTYYIYL